jgi:hypothetical protein
MTKTSILICPSCIAQLVLSLPVNVTWDIGLSLQSTAEYGGVTVTAYSKMYRVSNTGSVQHIGDVYKEGVNPSDMGQILKSSALV